MLLKRETQFVKNKDFTLRPPTMEDLTAIVDLLNHCAIDQTGFPVTSRSLMIADWTGPTFDPSASVRVVETGEARIVGYLEVWDTEPIPVSNWVYGRVHPDFEGLGIGMELMTWAEERLKRTLERVPKDLRVVFHSEALKNHAATKELLENCGMKLNRYFWRMGIDLNTEPKETSWPRGIRVKTLAELNDLRAVYRAFNDSFKDHWGYVEQPEEEMVEEWRHWISSDDQFDPALWFLAMDGDDVAGVCLCRRREWGDPDMGWVNILGVRQQWRRKGLALAMLHFAFGKFHQMGKLRVGLGVDAESLTGATGLYEKAGMHITREMYSYEKVVRPGRDISRQSN